MDSGKDKTCVVTLAWIINNLRDVSHHNNNRPREGKFNHAKYDPLFP